jgi:polyphosphate:AMP phosphotransferase
MLEAVDMSVKMKKKEYRKAFDELAPKLGELQRAAKEKGVPVILVVEGWEGANKGSLVNQLLQALDPRGYLFLAPPERGEEHYPFLIPYWEITPPAGKMTILSGSWYREVLRRRLEKGEHSKDYSGVFRDICAFERHLADSGTVILKFFCHLEQKDQKKRLEKRGGDPALSWSVTDRDWLENREYDSFLFCVEEMLSFTGTEYAPWTIVAASDFEFAAWKILSTVERMLRARLSGEEWPETGGVLGGVEYEKSAALSATEPEGDLDGKEYAKKLAEFQAELKSLEIRVFRERLPVIILFEGVDAAGKGGAIRRITEALYPMNYTVYPIGAPNDWERSHHYLWRFWKDFPREGHIAIFDRSWYGRVLVERVEGFCSPAEWHRAYREINETERHLTDFGTLIVKFWLQIDQEEQLRRFESRRDDPFRAWKLTDEDWRNREKWDDYQAAAGEMIVRTGTPYAPWTVVSTNSKKLARIRILSTVTDGIRRALDGSSQPVPDPKPDQKRKKA